MNTVTKIFVYGTLRSGFHHTAYEYISRHFFLVGKAQVKGKLYDLGEYPAAVPTDENCFITGELYALKNTGDFEWAMQQLDDYEGLNPEEGAIQLYRRETTEVFYNDESLQAWIYWYDKDSKGYPVIHTGDFFKRVTSQNNS